MSVGMLTRGMVTGPSSSFSFEYGKHKPHVTATTSPSSTISMDSELPPPTSDPEETTQPTASSLTSGTNITVSHGAAPVPVGSTEHESQPRKPSAKVS